MSSILVNGKTIPSVTVKKNNLNGQFQKIPLILSFPHSGSNYPDDFDTNPELTFEVLDFPGDKYVDELYSKSLELDLISIHANFPRTYIDVNRNQHNIDTSMLEKSTEWYGRVHPAGVETGTTLFWSKTKEIYDIYSRKLNHDELKHRLASCFIPYHQKLNFEIHQLYQNHGCAYVLDCHSMTQFDGKKRGRKERPQIDIGTRNGESCSKEYSECVADCFSDLGYDVTINGRFVGGEIILRYGWPEIDQHILQVEIRRDLYMNEENREKSDQFEKMQDDCGNALIRIKEYIKTKSNN